MKIKCFAQRLRTARLKAGYTQRQLAECIGKSRVTVTNYEAGRAYPKTEALGRLASQLSVSVDYLLGRNARRGNGTRCPHAPHR